MAVNARAEFLKNVKKFSKDMVAAAKEKAPSIVTDEQVCEMLDLGEGVETVLEAKVSKVRYGVDKRKNSYISFDYVLVDGPKKGLQIGDYNGIDSTNAESRTRQLKSIAITFDRLGVDLEGVPQTKIMDEMVNAADTLTVEKPGVMLSLSKYVHATTKKVYLNIKVVSMTDGSGMPVNGNSEDAGEDTSVDILALGQSADDGDTDAEEAVTALCAEAGIDVNDYATWEESAQAFIDLQGEEEPEEEVEEVEGTEEETEYAEVVDVSDEDAEYYETCIGYDGTFSDSEGDSMSGTVQSYDRETNMFAIEGPDGTEYAVSAPEVVFED